MPRPNLIERRMTRFLREPVSIRGAVGVIVTATAVVVGGGGVAMRLLDHGEYSNIWVGMWWALQTVTTVGYGDVTPEHVPGRVVGAFVMLYGIAFLTITIAAITSTFVARAERERDVAEAQAEQEEQARVDARFDDLSGRLDQVEQLLRQLTDGTHGQNAG
jgi:voltage-gated potassium channel